MEDNGLQAAARYELTANGQPHGERRGRTRTKLTREAAARREHPMASRNIYRHQPPLREAELNPKSLGSLIGIHDPSGGSALRRHQ